MASLKAWHFNLTHSGRRRLRNDPSEEEEDTPDIQEEQSMGNNYLITKDFDLTVAPVDDLCISRVLERVNLQMQRQSLEEIKKRKNVNSSAKHYVKSFKGKSTTGCGVLI